MKNCKNQPPRKLRCEDHDPMSAWSSQQGLDQSKLHRESLSQKRKQQRQRNKQAKELASFKFSNKMRKSIRKWV